MCHDHTPENAPDFRIEEYAKEHPFAYHEEEAPDLIPYVQRWFSDSEDSVGRWGAVAELVGIEVGVVSGVINLESSGVEASDWRLRHEQAYHEA